jgi:uncharacterized protein (TIRG00374 family)
LSSRLKSALQYTAIGLIGALFLYFVFKGTDWADLLVKFRQTNYWWIAAGMGVSLFSHLIRAIRANMLYEALSYRVSVKNSFYAVMVGYMMNYIIPRAGEVSRCASLLKTNDIPVNKSLGTVVTERLFDLIILAVMMMMVFLLQFNVINDFLMKSLEQSGPQQSAFPVKTILLGAVVVFAVALWFLRKRLAALPIFQKVLSVLQGFAEGLFSIRKVRNPILFIFLSILIWFCYLMMMYFCLFAMEATAHLGFMDCLTVFVIGSLGMIIPAPGAGAGTYHFAVMQSLLLFGVAQTDGIAYATIVHGVQMILLMSIGGICSLLVLAAQKKKST